MADALARMLGRAERAAQDHPKWLAGQNLREAFGAVKTGAGEIGTKLKGAARHPKDTVLAQIDQNGNGEVDIEDVIILGMKTPGIKVNRRDFLEKELAGRYPSETIVKVVAQNPAQAGIPQVEIDQIADAVIQNERYFVSGISAALGTPGGAAMVATIPADIVQYYGYTLRAAQKLMYLYGFPALDTADEAIRINSETMNILILCLGVMNGVAGANNAIKGLARSLAAGVEKQLLKKALTKGTFYPMVKTVAKWFGVRMTKEVFAGFFKNSIPVVGGVLGGGLTYLTFKPCCDNLKHALQDTRLSHLDQGGDALPFTAYTVIEGD